MPSGLESCQCKSCDIQWSMLVRNQLKPIFPPSDTPGSVVKLKTESSISNWSSPSHPVPPHTRLTLSLSYTHLPCFLYSLPTPLPHPPLVLCPSVDKTVVLAERSRLLLLIPDVTVWPVQLRAAASSLGLDPRSVSLSWSVGHFQTDPLPEGGCFIHYFA